MQKNDFEKFAIEMAALTVFGNYTPSKETIQVYFRTLADLTIEQIQVAVSNVLNTRTITSTFPVPAEIRNALGGGKSAALIALDKAEGAVERHGTYASVIFDDPVIHMVIAAMGGWPKFCCPTAYGDDQEWHWKQKEFVALYETFAKYPRAECPRMLVGVGDTSYTRGEETITIPPKIVGDKQKAMDWQEKYAQQQINSKLPVFILPDKSMARTGG